MRVKRGVKARRRRNRILKVAKGFRGRSSNTIRQGRQRAEKAMTYAFRDRRVRKREFRALWITRINAACRLEGLSYSKFIQGLKAAEIEIDRKVLAELGALKPEVFHAFVEVAKAGLKAA
jgi:large subunit ribosomal protein L20